MASIISQTASRRIWPGIASSLPNHVDPVPDHGTGGFFCFPGTRIILIKQSYRDSNCMILEPPHLDDPSVPYPSRSRSLNSSETS